jgi:hypothetical protein
MVDSHDGRRASDKKEKFAPAVSGSIGLRIKWNGVYYIFRSSNFVIWYLVIYTVWNLNFTINAFEEEIDFYHVFVLVTPIILSFSILNPEFWIIALGISLHLWVSAQIYFKNGLSHHCKNKAIISFINFYKTPEMQAI